MSTGVEAWRVLPPDIVESARSFGAGGREPVEPQDAATTVLLRDRPRLPSAREPGQVVGGLEVYLLRRHPGMAFAAGMYAFPGGRVDARDREVRPGWAGPTPAEWAERLGCDERTAQALVCAAVRETFEEAGVLLAGPAPDTVVTDTTGEGWEAERQALVERRLPFSDLLRRRGLVLRSDLLAVWAHWVTPVVEPRRYDTRFFVAALPAGQEPRSVSTEADRVCWAPPGQALAAAEAGEIAMLPPTAVTLAELSRYARAEDVLAAAAGRQVRPVTPEVVVQGDRGVFRLPGEPHR